MGKKLGLVALVLGAFLVVLAGLSTFYMYDRLAVVPDNNQTTSISQTAPGEDAEYLDVGAEGGPAVVTGTARYALDVPADQLPGLLHLKLVRSPHPHARIVSINKAPALAVPTLLSRQYIARSAATGRSASTVVATPRSGTTSLTLIASRLVGGIAYRRVSEVPSGVRKVTATLAGCALGLSTNTDI